MSLSAFAAPLARRLLTQAGFSVTFTRTTAGSYDPLENTASNTSVTWSGTAIWTQNRQASTEPTAAVPGPSARIVLRRTLFVAGLGLERAPVAGDAVAVAGITYRVADVDYVGDADGGAVPGYRVQVVK